MLMPIKDIDGGGWIIFCSEALNATNDLQII